MISDSTLDQPEDSIRRTFVISIFSSLTNNSFFLYSALDIYIDSYLVHTVCTYIQIAPIVVVVYHVTIVSIGHWLFKKFWLMVIGCVLRPAWSFLILELCRPAYFVRTTQLLP